MQSFEEIPVLLTPDQFAELTGRNADAVRRSIREGQIPADKVNNRYLICRDVVFKNAAAASRASRAREAQQGAVACV